jgi:hypothetical protein
VSIKGKIIEIAFFNIIKWFVIIIFAGIVLYFITPKYEIIQGNKCFNKITGRLNSIKEEK